MRVRKLAEPGWGGDAYPGEAPQYMEDQDHLMHDEPDYEPGSGDYNFFYGNGQLHVSPHHDHDALRGHAQVSNDHTGPMAVGQVALDRGRARWAVDGNVSMRGLHRVFKDYTKQVGWKWGGLTTLDGEPIDDDFAPKKSRMLVDSENGERFHFELQGKTAHLGAGNWTIEQEDVLRTMGLKIAEYPGGSNMNDQLVNYWPGGETLDTHNLGENSAETPEAQDDRAPTGTFRCPECRQIFPNWYVYLKHRRTEEPEGDLPEEDGKFPKLDMDKALPPHFHDRQPHVMPLASYKEAARVEGFDLYASLWGYDTDEGVRHYGAFLRGEPVGYASVREHSDGPAELIMVHASLRRHGVGANLLAAIQTHYPELVTGGATPEGIRLAKRMGMVPAGEGIWKWSAGSEPKDQIGQPIPFIYDIQQDNIAIGQPGQKTGDLLMPGKFTPGGIVEGTYEPGGKVVIQTQTNTPYSTRHLLDLWYWSLPHMQITGIEKLNDQGGSDRLASRTSQDVGTYVKTLALTEPAVWGAYQALRKAGGKVYVVGGAVRDALLQKEPKDIDLMVTGVPSEQVSNILHDLPGRVDLTGKSFGVYRYKTKGNEVEIALPRTETSTGDRRVDFAVNVDHNLPVEDDLLRRDFTVNSMAVDLDSGRLVDPYGGAGDIENRRLRTTHPASFQEDPTRLIRALVMNGRYGFAPDEQTRQEMTKHADRLPLESADNKIGIIEKLMKSTNPAAGIRLAHDTGLLKHIFPEVETHWDFNQNNPHHSYTLGNHLLNVLENVTNESNDPDLRLAALLHDIGKPASAWTNPETGFNHYYRGPNGEGDDHEIVGADMARNRLDAIRWPKARTNRIVHLISHHMFPAFSSDKGARKFIHRVGDEHADDLLTFRWADQHGKGRTPEEIAARTSVEKQRGLVEQARSVQAPTNQSMLAINGNDLIGLGLKPGPAIGRILRQLTDDVVEDPALNDREALLARAQEYAAAI